MQLFQLKVAPTETLGYEEVPPLRGGLRFASMTSGAACVVPSGVLKQPELPADNSACHIMVRINCAHTQTFMIFLIRVVLAVLYKI